LKPNSRRRTHDLQTPLRTVQIWPQVPQAKYALVELQTLWTHNILRTQGKHMNEAKKSFEAIMRSNGKTNFSMTNTGKYVDAALQTRWRYFLMGWELRGAR
jgi:hypothetical protein